ncbi:MAG: CoA pyrophosphatase [Syntrophobacterales bacterium]|nr:CoA pyrophosphatase [Syntrophobacterales bacterium]
MASNSLPYTKDTPSFLAAIRNALAGQSPDFQERLSFANEEKAKGIHYYLAGVCVPLCYQHDDWHVLLIKRSANVSQPGDLSFPGGLFSPWQDHLLKYAILLGIVPLLKNKDSLFWKNKDRRTRQLMIRFLATAVREAWEETGINPYNLAYLGSFAPYTLNFSSSIIFPSVCHVAEKPHYRLNDEVEQIIPLPFSSLFDDSSYYRLHIYKDRHLYTDKEFPCLLFQDDRGESHILWGATFFLLMTFLQTVYGFQMPQIDHRKRILTKTLSPHYKTLSQVLS